MAYSWNKNLSGESGTVGDALKVHGVRAEKMVSYIKTWGVGFVNNGGAAEKRLRITSGRTVCVFSVFC